MTVEGLTRVDDPDDAYEAVDVAEYHGGADFPTATSVVISQLKHSTRHPDLAWTAARLVESKTRRKILPGGQSAPAPSRSVLRDLAGVYQRLSDVHGRETVLGKLRIQLVSNRPVDVSLEAAVASASAIVKGRPSGRLGVAQVVKRLSPQDAGVINTLWSASPPGLTSAGFCDFLTVLDVSECGRAGRTSLERQVRANLAHLAPGRTDDAMRALYHRVRAEALPDQSRCGLGRTDVLACLGVGDIRTLYPAPRLLVPIQHPLGSADAGPLAAAVLATPGGTVIAHGPKGTGKTVTLTQLASHLPDGSLVVIYDCFGAGAYLNTGEERHTARRFATQVINELAMRCGTPLLLQPYDNDQDLWRRLTQSLSEAADALPADARLVLAVDAIDNAAYAAERAMQTGFPTALRALPVPSRVTLVLTARDHRLGTLSDRPATDVVLSGFDPAASAAHLRSYLPQAHDGDAAAFHERTAGNPRAQFYVLERARTQGWDVATVLAQSRSTPDELFADLVDSALHVSGSDIGGVRWLAMLAALSRPVRVTALTTALGVHPAQARAFASGLAPGVQIEDSAIKFRDEDFEHYVRTQLTDEVLAAAHSELADLFLSTRHTDADAAAHVADHLAGAGRLGETVDLVLDDPWPSAIADGFQRLATQNRRLDLALLGAREHAASRALQVVMRTVTAASSTRTLSNLVRTHVELVARHSDPLTVARQHLHNDADAWLGPAHMRAAGILSRSPGTAQGAREALDAATAWLRRRQSEAAATTRGWQLTEHDAAYAAEAYLRLDGPAAARDWLSRWVDPEFRFDIVTALAAAVAPAHPPGRVRVELEALRVPPLWHAPFLAFCDLSTQPPACDWIDQVTRALLRRAPGDPAAWKIRYAAVAARHGDRDLAQRLVEHWTWPTMENSWSYRSASSDGVQVLRVRALAAVLAGAQPDAAAMLPASLESKPGQGDYQREQWLKRTRPLLHLCAIQARLITGQSSAQEVAEAVGRELQERSKAAGHRWFRTDPTFRAWSALAAELVLDTGGGPNHIDQIADAASRFLGDQAPWLWLDLASVLSARDPNSQDAAAMCLRAADYIPALASSAGERLELLAECTIRADTVPGPVGEELFARTLQAAESIDDAAAELLAVHALLARRAASCLSPGAGADLAAMLAHATEHVARYASEERSVPYDAVLGAAARLHAPTAFATAGRWDDEERYALADALSPILTSAVDAGFMPVDDALCLRHLLENTRERLRTTLALAAMIPPGADQAARIRRVLRTTGEWLRRNVPATDQPDLAQRLLDWAAEHHINDQELHALLDPVVALGGQGQAADSKTYLAKNGIEHAAALLANPAARTVLTLPEDVTALSNAFVDTAAAEGFILAVAQHAAADRLAALDALAAVAPVRASYTLTVLKALAECARRWNSWPGVAAWGRTTIPNLLKLNLPALSWHGAEAAAPLREFGLTDDQLRTALLDALHEHRTALTTRQLHLLAALFTELVDPPAAADALPCLLARLLATTAPAPQPTTQARTAPDALAALLWSAFGHHRKAVRWQAAHAARDLLLLGNPHHADALVGHLNSQTADTFRTRDLHYYWLSARVWLLIALHGTARREPMLLVRHRQALIDIATSTTLPHAQIRELARWSALALCFDQPDELDKLALANQPATCRARRGYPQAADRRRAATARYSFDPMDTLPYWYSPLADVFDVPLDEVAERAERWIVDAWGLGEEDWMGDARELRSEKNAELMSHRQGSIPPMESLQLYLEYHAMMLAAGELVDARTPMLVHDYDDPQDPWRAWLDGKLPGSAHAWLADTRDRIPAEAMLFGHLPPIDSWPKTTAADFDDILSLDGARLPENVLVAGHTHLTRAEGSGTVYVRSALVAPAHAAALHRALQASGNPQDWRLPDENDLEFTLDRGPYELRGWLIDDPHWSRQDASIDDLDPHADGLSWSCVLPGRDFRTRTASEPDTTTMSLLDPHGQRVAWYLHWSDEDQTGTHRSGEVRSSGGRTFVRQTSLLRYLAATGMQMIVEVQIGRQLNQRTGSGGYNTPTSRIYRIDEHGQVHTL